METIVEKVWTKSKLLVKGLIISGLVLLLLIPTYYVQNLIAEREARQKEAIAEVSSKWASRQTITGPILVLPYWQPPADSVKAPRTKHFAYFLPDELIINSSLAPQEKHRGIYKVMLYTSSSQLSGSFHHIDLQKLNLPAENILWNEAFLKMNISDVKGLNDELILNWNNQPLTLSPRAIDNQDGLTAPLNISGADDLKNIHFSTSVNVNGSEQLLFTPVGKTTSVHLRSEWPHPSFIGEVLPQQTQVKNNGFSAIWKSLAHKRSFPQQWVDDVFRVADATATNSIGSNNIVNSSFGAELFVPVNGYQKTMRSIKYAVLCILLTFASFFLIETTHGKSAHPFQYGLIGLALILFYTLLLSFSEYINFNLSYIIASLATIGLIAWFVKGILASSKLSTILAMVLVLMYTYVFIILQLQDYALILGSIGLFITLAVIMSFSRKVQW